VCISFAQWPAHPSKVVRHEHYREYHENKAVLSDMPASSTPLASVSARLNWPRRFPNMKFVIPIDCSAAGQAGHLRFQAVCVSYGLLSQIQKNPYPSTQEAACERAVRGAFIVFPDFGAHLPAIY
jgi:hypothetical protein